MAHPREKLTRNQRVIRLYEAGTPLDQIAVLYVISRSRVYQIVRRHARRKKLQELYRD